MLSIGVDVGGTKIATAITDQNGHVFVKHIQPTLPEQGVTSVLDRIAEGITYVAQQVEQPIFGIGIGCPGPVDPEKGIAIIAANMGDAWRNIAICDEIKKRIALDVPVWADNDMNAEALGEMYFGAAKGHRDFVYISIGTGLGGCAVMNGQVLKGATFSAMELGYIGADLQGRVGAFGMAGAPEMYVSGRAFVATAQAYLPHYPESELAHIAEIRPGMIIRAARDGDALATRIIDEAAGVFGTVLAWCTTILNPSLIVIGGGLGHEVGDLLLDPAKAILKKRVLPQIFDAVKIVYGEVEVTALGAAALVWHGR